MDDTLKKHENDLDVLLEEELGTQNRGRSAVKPGIVVVDDDRQVLEALKIFLSDQYEIKVASSSKEALKVIDESTFAVLLDIKMPGRDGFVTFLDIKSEHPYLPIIFHSAYQDLKDPYDIMNYYRPFGYVQKTGSSTVLLDILASAVEYSRQRREDAQKVEDLQWREENLKRRIAEKVAEVEQLKVQTRRLVSIDELTGISNRRVFLERLIEELERVKRYDRELSLALIDIDSLRNVNDAYGYLQGDRVLQGVAIVLCSDKRFCDLSARIGGEEFGLILPETDGQGAAVYCERLRAVIETRSFPVLRRDGVEENTYLTVSIGVCHVSSKNKEIPVDILLSQTTRALYQAKEQGGNLCVVKEAKWS